MIVSTVSNIVVIILCVGVLVQTTRMIQAFSTFRKTDISETVTALDQATARAAATLSELKYLLATESAANRSGLAAAEALRDELSVMVGVGNSVAERIMEAAATVAPASTADAPPAPAAEASADHPLPTGPAVKAAKPVPAPRPAARRKPARPAAKPAPAPALLAEGQ
jgi:hypothetical protein